MEFEKYARGTAGKKLRRRRRRVQDGDDDGEEEYSDGGGKRSAKRMFGSQFLDIEAMVDSDDEEEEEEGEDDFIVDAGAELGDYDDDDAKQMHRRPLLHREDDDREEDIEALEKKLRERYGKRELEFVEEATQGIEQQALLPSVMDPKLWMVKCAIGREREVAACLMQKAIDKGPELQIRSVVALDHLKNYVYIEADKAAHVKEAIKGIRNIFASAKIMLVPIQEMADVLSVHSKAVDVTRDKWARIKNGTYKGDLAMVVNVDNVREKVTLKLIPRLDLQALAAKLDGKEVQIKKSKAFAPPPRFMNTDEVRDMHIRVVRRRDPITGDYFEKIGGMRFKDGFLYKSFSMKSVSIQNIQPTVDEFQKFLHPSENGDGNIAFLSTSLTNGKKRYFRKGDRVIVVKGELKNLKGRVQKVEEDTVYIKPKEERGLPGTIAISNKELCKYFEPGNHVKVVAGAAEGATGMVISVDGQVINIVSDTSKELLRVFADNIVETSEVTTEITRIGEYAHHNLAYDRHPHERAGSVSAKSQPCVLFNGGGGSRSNVGTKCDSFPLKPAKFRTPPRSSLAGAAIKVRTGPHKGCKGIVKEVKGNSLRVELEAQMRIVTVNRDQITDNVKVSTPFPEKSRFGIGGETPLRKCMTPMRDSQPQLFMIA